MIELDETSLDADFDVGAGDDPDPVIVVGHSYRSTSSCVVLIGSGAHCRADTCARLPSRIRGGIHRGGNSVCLTLRNHSLYSQARLTHEFFRYAKCSTFVGTLTQECLPRLYAETVGTEKPGSAMKDRNSDRVLAYGQHRSMHKKVDGLSNTANFFKYGEE